MKTLQTIAFAFAIHAALSCGCKPQPAGQRASPTAAAVIPNSFKNGPLDAARAELAGKPDLVRRQDAAGNTALHYAAYNGQGEIVKALLDAGSSPMARNRIGQSVLHRSVNATNVLVTQLLLDAGGRVNATDDHGRTPLIMAILAGHSEVVKLLIEQGADLNTSLDTGMTPLMVAARDTNTAVLNLLLEYKADTRARDQEGNTALHLAAGRALPHNVALLLAHKADLAATNRLGQTPLQYIESFRAAFRLPNHQVVEQQFRKALGLPTDAAGQPEKAVAGGTGKAAATGSQREVRP